PKRAVCDPDDAAGCVSVFLRRTEYVNILRLIRCRGGRDKRRVGKRQQIKGRNVPSRTEERVGMRIFEIDRHVSLVVQEIGTWCNAGTPLAQIAISGDAALDIDHYALEVILEDVVDNAADSAGAVD